MGERRYDLGFLMESLEEYRDARKRFLENIGVPTSNRDPVPEFAEALVAQLLDGRLAESRVEKYFDVWAPDPDGTQSRKVQVRTLSNSSSERWINEHPIEIIKSSAIHAYALVILEDLKVSAVLVFPSSLKAISAALGKRHQDQDHTLQFTRKNFEQIIGDRQRFEDLEMQVWVGSELVSHGALT